jgi:hypothetical protein
VCEVGTGGPKVKRVEGSVMRGEIEVVWEETRGAEVDAGVKILQKMWVLVHYSAGGERI